ncbi:MAG TPA: lipid-A-disaccharide synthase [Dongiaceae bacterium]|nr:lipid-A-disaccharide synthase [Dongiaceae bacterium]
MVAASSRALTIGIVAGELSGDQLGAGLMQAIKHHYPNVSFIGIGGPAMMAAGCESLFPMDRLSVMGVVEVLGRLRELLHIRKTLREHFLANPPDVFIGIDSPDFTLPLELSLKRAGIRTVHYVSPSVWAWRQKRVFKIKEGVDLMLTLLPFEAAFYEKYQVPVKFVGHPFATVIDPNIDFARAKRYWGFQPTDKVVAVLPGSRGGELKFMGPIFLETLRQLYLLEPSSQFIVACANPQRRAQLERQLAHFDTRLPLQIVDGHAREVMAGSDVVLATSGTVTLEAMLLKRPMVVAFRWGAITHAIISRMVKTRFISLPNLLAGRALVPEFLQDEARPEKLARALYDLLRNSDNRERLQREFAELHTILNRNASEEAAKAILTLVERTVTQPLLQAN